MNWCDYAQEDGQSTIALAWGALWLLLVVAGGLVTLAVYGAAWVDALWLVGVR